MYPELIEDTSTELGVKVKIVESFNFPTEDESSEPFNILLSMPTERTFSCDKFETDYMLDSKYYFKKLRKKYKDDQINSELSAFEALYPNVQNSSEWAIQHPEQFYIPFKDYFYDFSQTVSPIRYWRK